MEHGATGRTLRSLKLLQKESGKSRYHAPRHGSLPRRSNAEAVAYRDLKLDQMPIRETVEI